MAHNLTELGHFKQITHFYGPIVFQEYSVQGKLCAISGLVPQYCSFDAFYRIGKQ